MKKCVKCWCTLPAQTGKKSILGKGFLQLLNEEQRSQKKLCEKKHEMRRLEESRDGNTTAIGVV